MARIIILGAAGSLGRQVLRQSLAAGHDVTVVVRASSREGGCRPGPTVAARSISQRQHALINGATSPAGNIGVRAGGHERDASAAEQTVCGLGGGNLRPPRRRPPK